jgi:uracil-DNA glycosylase family 4
LNLWNTIKADLHHRIAEVEQYGDEEDEPEDLSGPETLEKIRVDLGDCQRCVLCECRKHLVFGEGWDQADLAIVGEAPGEHEDDTGRPFVGRAGKKLDDMLNKVILLPRNRVYICNVLKCRPPKNRDPYIQEQEACLPFLRRQIEAISPKVLLVLGSVAHKILFKTEEGVLRARGQWRSWNGIDTMSTFHPAFLIRHMLPNGSMTKDGIHHWRHTHEDLLAVRDRYDALGGWRPDGGLRPPDPR